jgi:predicted nucleic acid-binding protein
VPDQTFLLDTGPLVAYFNPRDEHHAWSVEVFKSIDSVLITCEPVLTEAFYLLSRFPDGVDRLADFCKAGVVHIDFRLLERLPAIRDLLRKYRNVPMDLADACMVHLAEEHRRAAILTTDRDFLIYRTQSRRHLRLIAPFNSESN